MKVHTTNELLLALKKFGITAYTDDGAVGDEEESSFFIGMFNADRKALNVSVGEANVTIEGDKKLRQVVINVREGERVHECRVSIYAPKNQARKDLNQGMNFPIRLPKDSTTYEVIGKVTSLGGPPLGGGNARYEALVRATVKPTHMSFLAGYDEENLFISALKHPRLAVASAHKELRPAGISTQAIRIGEWFFDPTSDTKTIQALNAKVAKGGANNKWDERYELEGMNHVVSLVADFTNTPGSGMVNEDSGKLYGAGVVYDTEERHPPMMLPGWCRIVRNNELVDPYMDDRFDLGGWD